MSVNAPYSEAPIFIEVTQRAQHHHWENDQTTVERRPIHPHELWADMDSIPTLPPTRSAFPGTPDPSSTVSGISGVHLVAVPGSATKFQAAVAGQFQDMVPAGWANSAYQPRLVDSSGSAVPYDPSVWVADGLIRGPPTNARPAVVEFIFGVPASVDVSAGIYIDYWQYIGQFVSPTTVVPDDVNLFVSAAGSDTAGTGAQLSPFATISHAAAVLRASGWNNTATISLLASGGPYAMEFNLNLTQGSLGAQATPLVITGVGNTVVFTHTVSAAGSDPASGLITVTDAGASYTSAQLGQVLQFTSGALSSYTPFPLFPPISVKVMISEVVSPTELMLPFAQASPAPGDSYTISAVDTQVVIVNTQITSDKPVYFTNMVWTLAGGFNIISMGGTTELYNISGIRLVVTGFGVVVSLTAITQIVTATRDSIGNYTALGTFIDSTTPGSQFAIIVGGEIIGATLVFSNSTIYGSSASSQSQLTASSINECYFNFTRGIAVGIQTPTAIVNLLTINTTVSYIGSVYLNNSVGSSGIQVYGGIAEMASVHVTGAMGSSITGLEMANGARCELIGAAQPFILEDVVNGIHLDNGCRLFINNGLIQNVSGQYYTITNSSTVNAQQMQHGASVGINVNGIFITDFSNAEFDMLVFPISAALKQGVQLFKKSTLIVSGLIQFDGTASTAINIDINSTCITDRATVANSGDSHVFVNNGSVFTVNTNCTLSKCLLGAGVQAFGNSTISINNATIINSFADGINVSNSRAFINATQCSASGKSGISILDVSEAICDGVSGNGNGGASDAGLSVRHNSRVVVNGGNMNTITGTGGDVLVGTNPIRPWGSIFTGQSQYVTDLNAFPPDATHVTEACFVTTH